MFKKTYTVDNVKRVNLNYINSAFDTGILGMSMFFIENSTENSKQLHTSTINSGLWLFEQNWGKFNLATSGYLKMGNGFTIQWGLTASSVNNSDYRYFPITFENTCSVGLASYSSFDSSGQGTSFHKIDKTKFLLGCRLASGEIVSGQVAWVAIGY